MTLKLLSIGVALGTICAGNAWAAEWAEGPAAPPAKRVSGEKENREDASKKGQGTAAAARRPDLRIRTPSIGGMPLGTTHGWI